ncbi:MAG: hypothetical protein IH948_00275 [Bacteroidetes bacterium]|nr:hypothetical protein [Bacteroidota bacterium]
MTEDIPKLYKINKGRRKISALTNNILEEEWITIEAVTKKECEDMFNKRWKEPKEVK